MPRQARYYRDWTTHYGWRYRLWIQPANDAGSTFDADLGAPAFGGDPGVGSDYIRLPEDAIIAADLEGEAAFADQLPIGLASSPTMKAGFDLAALVNASQSDLVGYLLDPMRFEEGLVQIGDATWMPCDTANVVCLLTDQGAGSEPTTVLFQGVQQVSASSTIDLRYVPGEATMSVTFVDIARFCLESVTPLMAARRLFWEHGDGDGFPTNSDRTTGAFYEYLYADGTTVYARTRQRLKDDVTVGEDDDATTYTGVYDKARLWNITQLMEAIRGCATDVYRSLLRPHSSQSTPIDFTTLQTTLDEYQNASPFAPLTFYKQGTTTANATGAEVGTAVSFGDELFFAGAVWNSYEADPTTYDEYEAIMTGGFLSEKDPNGLWKYPTIYDFLRVWSYSCYNRTVLTHDEWSWTMAFLPMWDGAIGKPALTRATLGKDGQGVDVKAEVGAGAITQANATLPSSAGEDRAASYRLRGIRPDDQAGFELAFSNSPTIGDSANRFVLTPDDSDAAYNPDIDYSTYALVGIGSTGVISTGIYYLDSASAFLTGEVPVRVHSRVDVPGVWAERGYPVSGTLPTISMPGDYYEFGDDPDGYWWDRMRARIHAEQTQTGLGYTVCRSAVDDFGSPKQTRYPLTFDLPLGLPDTVGTRYEFTEDDEVTPIDGSVFLSPGATWLTLPGAPYLTRSSLAITTGVAKIHLLAAFS